MYGTLNRVPVGFALTVHSSVQAAARLERSSLRALEKDESLLDAKIAALSKDINDHKMVVKRVQQKTRKEQNNEDKVAGFSLRSLVSDDVEGMIPSWVVRDVPFATSKFVQTPEASVSDATTASAERFDAI